MTIASSKTLLTAMLLAVVTLAACSGAGVYRELEPEPLDDAVLATRIKAAYVGREGFPAAAVAVDAEGGAVTLSGFVASAEQRALAEQLARAEPGVRSVDNRIEVKD